MTKQREAPADSALREQNEKSKITSSALQSGACYFTRKYNMPKIELLSVEYQIVLEGFPSSIAVASGFACIVTRTVFSVYIIVADHVIS